MKGLFRDFRQRRENRRLRGVTASDARVFSLIELVVVLSLLGLITADSIPVLGGLMPGRGPEELEAAYGFLMEAEKRSRRGASEVEVILSVEAGRYLLKERASGSPMVVEEGTLNLLGLRAAGGDGRFRAVFNPVGLGVGDTLQAGANRLIVDGMDGSVRIEG